MEHITAQRFRPLTGISLFLYGVLHHFRKMLVGFRPLTGISLFLLVCCVAFGQTLYMFSSPHGDFSFSIKTASSEENIFLFSSPHGDFSFSIDLGKCYRRSDFSFRPLTGISLFLYSKAGEDGQIGFRPLTGISLFL